MDGQIDRWKTYKQIDKQVDRLTNRTREENKVKEILIKSELKKNSLSKLQSLKRNKTFPFRVELTGAKIDRQMFIKWTIDNIDNRQNKDQGSRGKHFRFSTRKHKKVILNIWKNFLQIL